MAFQSFRRNDDVDRHRFSVGKVLQREARFLKHLRDSLAVKSLDVRLGRRQNTRSSLSLGELKER